MGALDGRRILVVGGSRGIGRAMATACAAAGAQVAVAARTASTALAEEIGAVAIRCDVVDDDSCRAAVGRAVSALSGLDSVIYATGITVFAQVADYDRTTLQDVFATNVFGAHSILAAAVPHLEAAGGQAIILNSESALFRANPWPGIAVYIASKQALDSLVRSFQVEHPAVAFTSYFVGSTVTDINAEGVEPFLPTWAQRGHIELTNALLPEDHGKVIVDLLTAGARVRIDSVGVRPRHLPGATFQL